MAKVMLIGLGARDARRMESIFSSVGVFCESVPTFESALEKIPADPPSLVIASRTDRPEPLHGLQSVLAASAPATAWLAALGDPGMPAALEAMRAGAFDCVSRPYEKFDVLAAAKRAALRNGRTLFTAKVARPPRRLGPLTAAALLIVSVAAGVVSVRNGPPPRRLNLGSATLSGIQWDGRSLWVGNWMDSTVARYGVAKAVRPGKRTLALEELYRAQDTQPILVCNTPDALITVGFDLKFRSHQRAVNLPTLQTVEAPGPNPTGLAWDGNYIWSSDGVTDLLYVHGGDLRVLTTVPSLLPNPVGIAWSDGALWVLGGEPLRLAKWEPIGAGVWSGPFAVTNFLPEKVLPTGMAVGFDRLWAVAGGDPWMSSKPLIDFSTPLDRWFRTIQPAALDEEPVEQPEKEPEADRAD